MNSRIGPQRLGKYELQEKLGRGGVAEVWKAFDTELHRYVAIKLLHADLRTDPEFMTRFTREARFIASLHHPNIVQIHDFQTSHSPEMDAPIAYMVMDYVEGETLADYIHNTSRVGKFPAPTDIVQLFAFISKALDYAHQEGMLHRDIKPANILLDKRHAAPNSIGEPVLTDFGIAKIVGANSDTVAGMLLGTPLYISPEQAQGYPGTELSDIYSLGVILYEMCTGVGPFRGESVTAIMMQHISSSPPLPARFNPAIPPALTTVILRAMAKDPAERFSSASALTAAIAEAFHLPVPAGLFPSRRPSNPLMQATQLRPERSGPFPHMVPPEVQWSQPLPAVDSLSRIPSSDDLKAQQSSGSSASGMEFPETPTGDTPSHLSFPSAGRHAGTMVPSTVSAVKSFPTPASPPTVRPWRDWKRLLIVWSVVLLVMGGSAMISFNALDTGRASPTATVGTLTFADSGQYDPNTTVGYNDVLSLSLHDLTPPQAGMADFAWLMPDQGDDQTVPLLLGRLVVNGGKANLQYTSPTHTNLLAQYSRVHITEQSANNDPSTPSLDARWEGSLSSTPNPQDPSKNSVLSHVRHLLAKDPTLQENKISGGLVIWMTRNVAKVEEWSSAAQGSWGDRNTDLIHKHMIRILDFLDGQSYAWQDVPVGSEWLVDQQAGRFGLLSYTQTQQPPGFLPHVNHHLDGLVNSPGRTEEQQKIAVQVDGVITRMINDLTKVRKDAMQLVKLNGTQLRQPDALTLLNEMAQLTTEVKGGWFDSATNQNVGGVIWLSARLHQLATISLKTSEQ